MTNIETVKLQSYMSSTDSACLIVTLKNGRVIYVPQNSANTDYQEYLKYVEEGGEVLPADEPAES